MLSVAEDYLRELNPDARLEVFGQELNAETYAICRSDMMLKGQDASHIALRQLLLRGRPRRAARSTTCSPTRRSAWSGRRSSEVVRDEHETLGLRRPLRRRPAADQRRQLPLPPAHDLEDEAAPSRAARGSRSSSTARRCSPARPARASRRSAAGSSRTTGSRPSSRCPTSSSTTPASRPTSGSSPTASAPSDAARCSSSTPASSFVKMRKSLGEKRKRAQRRADRARSPALYGAFDGGRAGEDLPQRAVRLPADHRRAAAAAALDR